MLETEFLGNSLRQYAVSLGAFLPLLLGIILTKRLVSGRLRVLAERTEGKFHDALAHLLAQIRAPELALLAFYLCVRHLRFPHESGRLLHLGVILVLTYRGVRILQEVVDFLIDELAFSGEGEDPARRVAFRNIAYLVNGLLWLAGLLFALANLGINVSALLAGLGIGGIAVALAAQAILADLFSAVAIYLDKPFSVGDAIEIDAVFGVVEHIGVKTTRVRALSGEVLVFANSYLTAKKIGNFQRLRERRIVVNFTVPFQTENAKLKRIPKSVSGIVAATEGTRFDRAHFKKFAESGFEFELVYFVLSPDYTRYMDLNQSIHFAILDLFDKEGVQFAHPTRTLIHTGKAP